MAKYFTSIFHEEVIPVNEFKGEAEAYYSQRRGVDKALGDHNNYRYRDGFKKERDSYRDKGRTYGEGEPATNAEGAKKRIERAKEVKDIYDKNNKIIDDRRAKDQKNHGTSGNSNDRKRAKNESFLPDIELI